MKIVKCDVGCYSSRARNNRGIFSFFLIPGELRYDAVGIPYVLDLEPSHTKVSRLMYEEIEEPIRLNLPGPGQKCTQYFHGRCYNALLKLAARCDVEGARNLLESEFRIRLDLLLRCNYTASKQESSGAATSRFARFTLQHSFRFC